MTNIDPDTTYNAYCLFVCLFFCLKPEVNQYIHDVKLTELSNKGCIVCKRFVFTAGSDYIK